VIINAQIVKSEKSLLSQVNRVPFAANLSFIVIAALNAAHAITISALKMVSDAATAMSQL
jgi:hypothetical protein